MTQLTDEQYYHLSQEAYRDTNIEKGKEIETDSGLWVVINKVNNNISGLQGIAVAPADEYSTDKKDCSNIVFVSRGTSEKNDWVTNVRDLGFGEKPSEISNPNAAILTNQFSGYQRFVEMTLSKYNVGDYSFTGHSLGGALAQYVAVIFDKKATTFSAAKAYRLLPVEFQKFVDSGHYKNKIVDYRHEFDVVGLVPFGNIIGKQFNVKRVLLQSFSKATISCKMERNSI